MSDEALMWDEVVDIGALLHELDDASFDAPSLCAGWAVRDVIGHMSFEHTTPLGTVLGVSLRHRFNLDKTSFVGSKAMFADSTPDEIRAFWDDVMIATHPGRGLAKLTPKRAGFLDHLIHNQDIRRPTGHGRVIPEQRLYRALEVVQSLANPMFNPKRTVAGLTLRATDIGWSAGVGPVVEGPGEAVLMAAGGRPLALDELTGDGLATLKSRITGGVIK